VRIDRIQLVVPNLAPATAAWQRLLGAESVREDSVEALGARRVVLALGESEVELLTPTQDGAVADFLARRQGGLFAAGIAVADVRALEARLAAKGVAAERAGDQRLLSPEALGIPGLRLVISPLQERPRVGRARFLYEVTHLCVDPAESVRRFARLLDLPEEHFVPIRSQEYGYEGTLTLFHPDRLDRLEIIHPFDASRTMGRFFAKHGPCLYMAYAESDATDAVRAACLDHAPADFTGPREGAAPDNLFLHPRALGGMMLGVSRTTFAWTWSGHPERVAPAPR
jgi:catechol 2,3-dioxygenase-like lactoylglutathione lyase family enzyme